MKKLSLFLILAMCYGHLMAQSETTTERKRKQDIGINMVGLAVKNQPTVASSLFYRYQINNYQLRLQLIMDGKYNSGSRNTEMVQKQGGFGGFEMDSAINFDPGKSTQYGAMAGLQKNFKIMNSPFSYFYGFDFIYLQTDYQKSGSGQITQSNGGGFDTTKQRIGIKLKENVGNKIYGIGIPIGINYRFSKVFYANIEAKFLVSYQKTKTSFLNETSQTSQFQEFTTRTESSGTIKGVDFGIRPLSAITVGFSF